MARDSLNDIFPILVRELRRWDMDLRSWRRKSSAWLRRANRVLLQIARTMDICNGYAGEFPQVIRIGIHE